LNLELIMKAAPQTHHRRSIRLKRYDYAQPGAYFVTICAQNRECLFGEIVAGEMRLSEAGRIVLEEWERIPKIRSEIQLGEWIIMPNHIHGVIVITEKDSIVGAHGRAPLQDAMPKRAPRSLGALIAGIKSITTKRINVQRGMPGAPVWQRNYYEHIIRNEAEWEHIRGYIQINPVRWEEDQLNPRPS